LKEGGGDTSILRKFRNKHKSDPTTQEWAATEKLKGVDKVSVQNEILQRFVPH
jgi:hypothetical protein